ncbi:MAG TPA: Crp/Fnr family transcriptional regulator [Myxococcales bacterium]|jgi:CRP-like cAMP-binding protein|nr:Crp/Fnr family transcriptional regulator [Myxococcales bacterium]
MDRFAALRASSLLTDFSDVGVRILAESCEERSVGRGTYAFRAGEPSTALVFIGRGTLQLQVREGGQPLGEVKAGDTLGNFALLAEGEHLLSAWAATDVELAVLERESFEALRKQKPQASLKLMLALAHDFGERLRDARGPFREFLAWQVSKRQTDGGR